MWSLSFTLFLYHQVCQGSDSGGRHRLFGEKVPWGDLRYRSGPLEVTGTFLRCPLACRRFRSTLARLAEWCSALGKEKGKGGRRSDQIRPRTYLPCRPPFPLNPVRRRAPFRFAGRGWRCTARAFMNRQGRHWPVRVGLQNGISVSPGRETNYYPFFCSPIKKILLLHFQK